MPAVTLLGQQVAVVAEIDQQEHRRRSERGIGAVVDYQVLDALCGMPEQAPIRDELINDTDTWLDSSHEMMQRALSLGAVEFGPGTIMRTLRRPCRVVGVLRWGGPWLETLEQISMFAPLSARAVVLSPAAGGVAAELEAASLGIGLVRCGSDASEAVVPVTPAPTSTRLSTGQWLSTEVVYAAWARLDAPLDS